MPTLQWLKTPNSKSLQQTTKVTLFFSSIFKIGVLFALQNFAAGAGQDYDNPKVKPSSSANAIYSLAMRYVVLAL